MLKKATVTLSRIFFLAFLTAKYFAVRFMVMVYPRSRLYGKKLFRETGSLSHPSGSYEKKG